MSGRRRDGVIARMRRAHGRRRSAVPVGESVINRRSDDTGCPPGQPWIIADGALRTLGFDGDFAVLHKQTGERLGLQPLGVA